MAEVFGFLNINKPLGMTSHDVVAKIRRVFKIKKVGHAGTLDPLAQGVLVLCLGNATRLSDYVMHSQKIYLAEVRLGQITDTYDAEGQVITTADVSHLKVTDVHQAIKQFEGDILQIPPMYSAIKKDGKKLYELARAGEVIELQPRPVTIFSIEYDQSSTMPIETLQLRVTCSAGTYIRSLAHDIGQALGVGAHLAGLTRLRSGTFDINDAHLLDDVLHDPVWESRLVDEKVALAYLPAIQLDEHDSNHVLHGRNPLSVPAPTAEMVRAYSPQNEFIALLRADGGTWRPHKVFASSSS